MIVAAVGTCTGVGDPRGNLLRDVMVRALEKALSQGVNVEDAETLIRIKHAARDRAVELIDLGTEEALEELRGLCGYQH